MGTSQDYGVAGLELLTIEEAAAYLRIGRTKAYAMARQWRDTGGRAGLPVVDLGSVLRVPRRALEEMLDTGLHRRHATGGPSGQDHQEAPSPTASPRRRPRTPAPVLSLRPSTSQRPSRRRRQSPESQPALFDPPPSTRR